MSSEVDAKQAKKQQLSQAKILRKINISIMYLKKTFLTILALAICSISFPAHAQSPSGELRLTTSPLPINLKVMPGSSVSTPLKIKNDGTQDENLKAVLMKFKADPTTGATLLSEREATDQYFDWVTFSEPTFTLKPNEWKTITATFNVPATAAFDYYYSIVFFRADQQVKAGDRQTVLNGGTATMVLLTAEVPGAKKELQLEQFSVEKNIFEFLPVNFSIKIRNTGNVHVIPHGNIFINDGGQKDVAILNVNDTQGSILPDSPRSFQSNWKDGFPVYTEKEENGVKSMELKWNFADASKLRWGKHTAKLLVVYDNGQRDIPIEGEVTFWVIPWRLIGGGFFIAIFVFIGLKSTLQNFWKRIKGLMGKHNETAGKKTSTKKK
jgi:hypothetical protein